MTTTVQYLIDQASEGKVNEHLLYCDADFIPPLSERVALSDYTKKILRNATRLEAWLNGTLVGLVAAYCNDQESRIAHITSVSVVKACTGQGIGTQLIDRCVVHARAVGMQQIRLEVDVNNSPAIHLYEKYGFVADKPKASCVPMTLDLERQETMNNQRDYNVELSDTTAHRYAYGFDLDVMHPYMIESFRPFFQRGRLLELGSFRGDFTLRFAEHFSDITCVEASDVAAAESRKLLGERSQVITGRFEEVALVGEFENIVMTHVLEHLDDPVSVLRRVNDEWLSPNGYFFLVCPNANAPSRQIAVKMGLISHNSAVTSAEEEHGHRRTYSLDTLERDAVAAGLEVVHRSGIFFKAMANFQWDRLLQTDIISKEYLDGCYKLGQHYPDLCSSIFLLCRPGTSRKKRAPRSAL